MNKKLKTLLVSLAVLALVGVSAACFAILPKANMKPSDYDLGVTYAQALQYFTLTGVLIAKNLCQDWIK